MNSLLLIAFVSCLGATPAEIDRESFEDEWWYSEKLDACACFINTSPEYNGYDKQVLLYDIEHSSLSMLSAWEFESPNLYRVIPVGDPAPADLVFYVRPDEGCWDIGLNGENGFSYFHEVMCDCSQREG